MSSSADSDFCVESTFSPKTQWSEEFAQGEEIRDYWQTLAKQYNLEHFLRLGRRVDEIEWNDDSCTWRLVICNKETKEVYEENANFVLTANGRFNDWRLPTYPGMNDYQGLIRHTSDWDPEFDPTGKNVAVIGNGASGIQVMPALCKIVNRLDHYARSRTWIAGTFTGDERTLEPKLFSPQQLEMLEDPAEYLKFRKQLEEKNWRKHGNVYKGARRNAALREDFTQIMAERLDKRPELLESIVPDFSPYCRRLTPGPGYLEALCEENVDFVQEPIKRFTPNGIETVDGKVREVEAIFCATGANIDTALAFSIIARGIDLNTAWKPDGKFRFPYTYLGIATPGFPNLLFIYGPHASVAAGSVTHNVENQITYFAKLLRKVSSQGIKSIVPSSRAADDFVAYSDAYFATTVFTEHCSSWYNGGRPGGRVHGLWPGSGAHAAFAHRDPRWEDWEYEYLSPSGNRFAYFGNGWTKKEQDPNSDMTPYLRVPDEVDLRTIHENWFDV